MTKDELEATEVAHAAIVTRLLGIVAEAPFWQFVGEPSFASFEVDGDDVILSWPETETYYDSTTIETRAVRVPVSVLLMSDEELAAWKVAEKVAYDRKQEATRLANIAAKEAQERAVLAALKQRYPDAWHPSTRDTNMSTDDIGDLEAAIAEFRAALPGWWFTTGTCSVSCDATIGPDRAYVSEPILTIFDEGVSVDLRQPSTAANALRHVTREAVDALRDPQAYAIANPLYRDRHPT